jgi:hypothetical protein
MESVQSIKFIAPMTFKCFPSYYITYTNTKSASGHYLQVSKKDNKLYEEGGEWRNHALFIFEKASDYPDYYTIRIKDLSNGYVTWTNENSINGHYLQVLLKDTASYDIGGNLRDHVLFKLNHSEEPGYYIFTCKQFPSAYFTWTWTESISGHYLQLSLNYCSDYEIKGKNRDHVLIRLSVDPII